MHARPLEADVSLRMEGLLEPAGLLDRDGRKASRTRAEGTEEQLGSFRDRPADTTRESAPAVAPRAPCGSALG